MTTLLALLIYGAPMAFIALIPWLGLRNLTGSASARRQDQREQWPIIRTIYKDDNPKR